MAAAHTPRMTALARVALLRFLPLTGALWGLLVLAAVTVAPALAEAPPVDARVAQAVSRLTYGAAPGELDRVASMGVPAFIASQLEPERLDDPPELTRALAALPTESMDTVRLFREYGPSADGGAMPDNEAMRNTFDRVGAAALEAARARLLRAVLSRKQLYELMVAFWCEHFNLGAKGLAHLWAGSFEREAIRPHAMGRFLDLLAATAMHPAMLIARDNWKNVVHRDGDAPYREDLNTTYAATLLAHQTLGQDGPQKPDDVKSLARILTGWRVGATKDDAAAGGFSFDVDLHDPGDKMFLGHPVKGTGLSEGATALRILAAHPATAKHLCRKLAVYFLADDPPAALVGRMVETFRSTDGDIREVLRTLFTSQEFFDPNFAGSRFKPPLRQAVSAVRALGITPTDTTALAGKLLDMGEPFFASSAPEGYPLASGPWLTPDAVMRRITFAGDLAAGRIAGLGSPAERPSVDALIQTVGPGFSERARQAAGQDKDRVGLALLLASPGFMRY